MRARAAVSVVLGVAVLSACAAACERFSAAVDEVSSDGGDAGPDAADGAVGADAPSDGLGDAGGDAPSDGPCETGLDCVAAGLPRCCCMALCVAPSSCSGDLGGSCL
jgi:hypothetical protein